jgi:hypothetical protein
MSRNITTLRDLLFDAIAGVKSGDLDLDKAKTINELSKTLVDTARAEIDHAKITGGMAGDFLDAGTTNRLPAPGHQTQERTAHGIRTTTTTPEGAVVHQHRMRG